MTSRNRLIAWTGLVLATVYLVLIGGTWYGIYFSELRIPSVAIAGAGLAVWAVLGLRKPDWLPQSGMFPAAAACLATLSISTAFSRAPRVSLEYLGYGVVLAALYLMLVRLLRDEFFRLRMVNLVVMLFGVLVVVDVSVVAIHWTEWWSALGHVAVPPLRPYYDGLTYGNPSTLLALVVMLGMSVIGAKASRSRPGRAVLGLVVILIAVIALTSGSRAGWLALGMSVLVLGGFWFAAGNGAGAIRSALAHPKGRTVVLASAAVVAISTLSFVPALAQRVWYGGEDLRIEYLVVAARLFLQSPIVGTGPGTWAIERAGETASMEPDYYVPHAHNIEMQTAAELGTVGLIAGVFLIVQLIKLLIDGLRDGGATRRRWAIAASFGILYFGFQQLLDYHREPGLLFAAAFPFAYLDATAKADGSRWRLRSPSRSPFAIGALVVGVAIIGLLVQEVPALQQSAAVAAANDGEWAAADAPARAAALADPGISPYVFTAGLTASRAGDHVAAADSFRVVALRDDYPEAWVNLAAEEALLGHRSAALAAIQASLRLGHQRTAIAVAGGELALRLGDRATAIQAFANALARGPSLAADPWWAASPARKDAFEAALPTAISIGTADARWEIALMIGDDRQASELAKGATDPRLAELAIAAWHEESGSQPLFAECSDHPLDLELVIWCARVASRYQMASEALNFRRLARALSGGGYARSFDLRIWGGQPDARKAEGRIAAIWGTFSYRRELPHDVLVPDLVHLTSLD